MWKDGFVVPPRNDDSQKNNIWGNTGGGAACISPALPRQPSHCEGGGTTTEANSL